MKRLSIIPIDRTVVIDAVALTFAFEMDADIHAVQWNEDSGHIEYNDGRPNETIDSIDPFMPIIELYNTELSKRGEQQQAQEEAEATEKAEREAFEQTYVYKRQQDYPDKGDQFDQMWRWLMANGLEPDTSSGRNLDTPEGMAGEIKTVKFKHPKSE